MAILNGIHRLVKEREYPDILSYVFVSITQRELPTWEESLQVEAGNGFLTALSRNAVPQTQLESLVRLTLTLLSTWSAPVHAVWLQVLSALFQLVPQPVMKKHCIPVTLHLGEYSQAVATRIVATQLIGMLAENLQQEFRGDILQKAMMLAQDTSYEIRKIMCIQLKKITRGVSEDLQPRVFGEVLKLVNDEEVDVKCEAASLLIDIIDLLPFDIIQGQVLPVLRTDLLPTRDFGLRQSLAENFGILIVKLEAELQDEEFRDQCLTFYRSLVMSEHEKERKAAAFNFPAVLSTLGATAFSEDLKPLYEHLSKDICLEVKQIIAASFHEVLRLSIRENRILGRIFMELLSDMRLITILLRNLSSILVTLSPEIGSSAILSQILNLLNSHLPWRQLDQLLKELVVLLDLFPLSELLDRLQPVLFAMYVKSCLPMKIDIAKLVAEIVHRCYVAEKRGEVCAAVVGMMCESENAQDRIVFVEFCIRMLTLNSRRFFRRHFFDSLLRLSSDPVHNVRLKLAQSLVTFLSSVCTEQDMQSDINSVVTQLMSDSDLEVSRLAGQVQMHTMSREYWNSVQTSEKEEAEKLHREELQDVREQRVRGMQEKEEAKKKLVQDLTEKARMDYLMQYKEKKLSGSTSIPRKNVLKGSLTSARIPPPKPMKTEALPKTESGRRSVVVNGSTGTMSSPKLAPFPLPPKSATAKIPVISRKK